VEPHPNNQKPSRPIEAVKQKHASHNGKNPDGADPKYVIIKGMLEVKLGEMVEKPDTAG
jgi:hypothetical protein